jgi:hypothetical protein
MIASRSASRRSSRLPERSFSGGYGSPAPWEIGAGLARLRQLLRCGHEDASPHKWGGDREHGHRCWKKALKRRRLALKSRHRRWSSAYPTARRRILRVGVTAARRRARGGDCAASQPRVLAARSCAQPPRERSGRQTPEALRRRPIRPRLLTNDSHRDERRGVRGDCADDDTPRLSQERGRGGSRRIKTALRSFSPCHSPPQPRA